MSQSATREAKAEPARASCKAAARKPEGADARTRDNRDLERFLDGQSGLVVQRKCACNGEEDCTSCTAQRSAAGEAAPDASGVADVLRSSGQPLDVKTRALMERSLGHDFSGVRIHADPRAAASARAMSAVAYTVGRDVVFDAGAYAPQSASGRQLLAHELAHVIQQSRGAVSGRAAAGGVRVSEPDDAFERQADAMAARVNAPPPRAGTAAPLAPPAAPSVQRQTRRGAPAHAPAATAHAPAARPRTVPTIVEDNQHAGAGQMTRTAFLDALHASLAASVESEFRRIGRPGRDCPYILRTIARYRTRPIAALMRVISAFARPAPGTDALGVIAAVTARARLVAQRIAAREQPRAQAATASGAPTVLPAHEPAAIRAQLGAGRALDGDTRSRMERSFGASFAGVRVHDDASAARFNAALGARAFTIGHDIAFSTGQYAPGTPHGDRLLAHELAHTVQQGPGAAGAIGGEVPALEREADRAADAAVRPSAQGAASLLSARGGPRIQRAPVVLAGALIVAEATPEIIVVAEVATVSTEVVVVDTAIVAAADVALPTVLEVAAPTVVEAAAPTVVATVAPTVAATSTYATAATVSIAAASTQLSGDSSEPYDYEDERPRTPQQRCMEFNPSAMFCDPVSTSVNIVAAQFIARNGYAFTDLTGCSEYGDPFTPDDEISACNNGPGKRYHCGVRGTRATVSVFACECCDVEGNTSHQYERPHWSVNLSRRGQ